MKRTTLEEVGRVQSNDQAILSFGLVDVILKEKKKMSKERDKKRAPEAIVSSIYTPRVYPPIITSFVTVSGSRINFLLIKAKFMRVAVTIGEGERSRESDVHTKCKQQNIPPSHGATLIRVCVLQFVTNGSLLQT